MSIYTAIIHRLIPKYMITTAAYYIAFAVLGLVGASLGPTLPGLAANTQSGLNQISYLFIARSLGYLCGSLLGGRLYDRVAGHPLMALALLLMAIMMFVVPLAASLTILLVILLFIGIGEGVLDVGGNTLIVWHHREGVAPFMNGMHFFFGVGAFLAPLIVGQALLRTDNIAWAYWSIGLITLPAAVWLSRLRSPSQPKASPSAKTIPHTSPRLLMLIFIFFILYVGAEVSYGGWIFTYAGKAGMLTEEIAAYITSAFWIAFTVARLISIPLSARIPARTILTASVIGALASLLVIIAAPKNELALWIGSIGFGLSVSTVFPTMLNFAGKRMAITGKTIGYFFLGSTIGAMSLPALIGQFFEPVGPQFMMYTLFVDMLLVAAVLTLIIRASARTRSKKTS